MQDEVHFTLIVNGRAYEVSAPPDTPLLDVLREDLGLRATRFGCGQGACGACTVLLDGRAVMSCDLPVSRAEGARIETAEGLVSDGRRHPVLEALLAHQAGQCGYCLPGIAMAAKALLASNPDPDAAEIRQALDGNLCRCGAHPRILRAVADAAARMRA